MEEKERTTKTTLSVAASAADSISWVLGNDDLLHVILLRLLFLICLVCAALVCKYWYHVVSDPGFLRRFRHLHPPPSLGSTLRAIPGVRPRCWASSSAVLAARVGFA
ncbi:hypothetical protein PR202_ga07217 [Eleusine coracana subsp. coracana]|uniref:F-box domain-containing protein n=1 Tax=Eleusine coracana subsp. coracana TaxID=191504 RepID=A0AAV5C062_ELECO|nr:hypothetical protein PR202_ga07217 [Eleusine coracana subsp. coracana]